MTADFARFERMRSSIQAAKNTADRVGWRFDELEEKIKSSLGVELKDAQRTVAEREARSQEMEERIERDMERLCKDFPLLGEV